MDFIIIGAQKAGTTWLYKRLCELDDFDMPPVKELHYFDRSSKYHSTSLLSHTSWSSKIQDRIWLKSMLRDISSMATKGNIHQLKWAFKYYFATCNDAWYLSMAKQRKGLVGDITPAYAMLEQEDIQHMYQLLPKAKIIFLIRNPVDRVWSSFKYYKRGQPIEKINQEDVLKFADWEGQKLRSDYLRTLELYSSIYPKQQILLGFYDAIVDQPLDLLTQVVSFVGGTTANIESQCNLKAINNTSLKMPLPPALRKILQEKYQDMIQLMAARFGAYANNWLGGEERMESCPSVIYGASDTIGL